MTEKTTDTPEILPVSRFNDFIPFPSTGAIRQWIFANTNGFNDLVLRRLGKRLYIHVPSFFEWVEKSKGNSVA